MLKLKKYLLKKLKPIDKDPMNCSKFTNFYNKILTL